MRRPSLRVSGPDRAGLPPAGSAGGGGAHGRAQPLEYQSCETSPMTRLLAGIEAGGTKFVCALGTDRGELRAEARFPTTSPEETIEQAVRFLRAEQAELGEVAAVGIAAFGPLDLRPRSPSYGHITSTPKPGWANTDLRGSVAQAMKVPVAIDTDVNAAALADWRWGSAKGLDWHRRWGPDPWSTSSRSRSSGDGPHPHPA
jgi:hypothetical protein